MDARQQQRRRPHPPPPPSDRRAAVGDGGAAGPHPRPRRGARLRSRCLLAVAAPLLLALSAGPAVYFLHRQAAGSPAPLESSASVARPGRVRRGEDAPQRALALEDRDGRAGPMRNATSPRPGPSDAISPPGAIPNVLIFTHYVNLLEANLTALRAARNMSTEEFDELVVLQRNIHRIVHLHPGAQVRFLTDDDCIRSLDALEVELQEGEGGGHDGDRADNASLADFFRRERHGMYKADLCRGTALHETGGLYFDVDLGVRMNVFEALAAGRRGAGLDAIGSGTPDNATASNASTRGPTTFCTVRVHARSNRPGAFFQAFIGAAPRHPVLRRYVALFGDYYRGRLPEFHGEPLGVVLLKRALDEVLREQPALAHDVQLWQEVQYRPEMVKVLGKTVPYPTWGRRRACRFIVLSSPTKPWTVPFYSRIAGSRMCPANEDTNEEVLES